MDLEHEAADRHGGIAAIFNQFVPGLVSRLHYIQTKRLEKIKRVLRRKSALRQYAAQRDAVLSLDPADLREWIARAALELVRRLKGDTRLKSVPVVIVSYKDREEDRLRGLEAGADYYLTKSSFHDETLVQAVRDLIGEAGE